MMYRRTEDEEESGSDWDELTPRTPAGISPSYAAAQAGMSPPLHQSSLLQESGAATDHSAAGQGVPGVGQPRIPTLLVQEAMQSSLVQPHDINLQGLKSDALRPQGLVSQAMNPRALNLQGLSAQSMSSQGLSSVRTEHIPPSLPGNRHMETGFGAAQTFEDGLMSIATAKTPTPPPPKTPPSAKSVYRVPQEREGLENGGERGASPVIEGEQDGCGDGGRVVDMEYRMELEFTTVSGQRADYLTPAHHPPHAYMTGVATKWENRSKRCVEEFCSSLRLVSDFLIAFILGSAHCLLNHIFRKLCCGLGQILSDSFFKPLVTLCFNGFLWPVVAGFVQLSRGVVLTIGPLLEIVGVLMSWVVQIVRNCRLVVFNNKSYQVPPHKPQHQI